MLQAGDSVTSDYRYVAFGLRIRSQIPLPDIESGESPFPGAADVCITLRPDAAALAASEAAASADFIRLALPGIAVFEMVEGREIRVSRCEGASDNDVRLCLLGSAFGLLWYQRGLIPLHASAVIAGGRGVAFAGVSGSGKSTLAAALHRRALPIFCDDVCVLDVAHASGPVAYPALARLRLWEDAARKFGHDTRVLPRVVDSRPKYYVAVDRGACAQPVTLDRIYVIEDATEPTQRPTIDEMRGAAAAKAVFSHLYRREHLRSPALFESAFQRAFKLVQSVPVFAVRRNKDDAQFEALCDLVQSHIGGETAARMSGDA